MVGLLAVGAAVVLLAAPVLARQDSPQPDPTGDGGGTTVLYTQAEGPVTPVMARNLADAVDAAESGGHEALVVRLDTPGGLVTSMRDIVKEFLNAPTPVVVWVAPAGGGAASAGYVITTAAHVAAMAPGTNIGAATPVSLGGGQEQAEVSDKVVNDAVSYAKAVAEQRGHSTEFAEQATRDGRSVTAETALDIDVIDLLAADRAALLDDIDGREVTLDGGATTTLRTADAAVVRHDPSFFRRVLQWLADPNLAFLFLSIAPLAIIYELANPGVGAGGIVGAILIVLALFSLSALPVNAAGVALLALAVALFIGEVFVPGIGVLGAGGTVSLLLAGLFLFDEPTGIGVDLTVLIPTVILTGLAAVGLAVVARRTWSRPAETSQGTPEGAVGEVRRWNDDGTGQIFTEGARWQARAATDVPDTDTSLDEGDRVRVVDRDGLVLIVAPVSGDQAPPAHAADTQPASDTSDPLSRRKGTTS